MKWFVVACLLVASAQAGLFSGRLQGGDGQGHSFDHHSNQNHHSNDFLGGGAILLVKQSPSSSSLTSKSHRGQIGHRSHGNQGRSLTVSGPTHLVRTIHHIQQVDNGGQVLARSYHGGSDARTARNSEQKFILLVKTDQVNTNQHRPSSHHGAKVSNSGW